MAVAEKARALDNLTKPNRPRPHQHGHPSTTANSRRATTAPGHAFFFRRQSLAWGRGRLARRVNSAAGHLFNP